jgi:hypothetical protein
MKLIAPMSDVLQWLKGLRDEGSDLVVAKLQSIEPDAAAVRPRLIDARRINVFTDPNQTSAGGAVEE